MQCRPDILVNADGLISAPEQATAKEAGEEEHAIVPLRPGSSHVKLIEEPVKVEEGGGQLVEDEGRAVEVDERSLRRSYQSHLFPASQTRTRPGEVSCILTNPNEKTTSAATACANSPHPNTPTFPAHTMRSHRKYPAAKP